MARGAPPLGQPPATPWRASRSRARKPKVQCRVPKTRTPALKASGQQTPSACPKDRQPREDECLTPDAPQDGARHPPRGRPPATCTARNPGSEERTHAVGLVLGSHTRSTQAQKTQARWAPAIHPKDGQPGEGERLTPDVPRSDERYPPPGNFPPPRAGSPHAHRLAPAIGQRSPTACPKDRQPCEDEGLTPDIPPEGARHTPRDALPPSPQRATPAHKSASRGVGAWSLHPHQPRPEGSSNGPRLPVKRTGSRERESA